MQLLGTAEFPNEAGSTSSAITSSSSIEVFKRRHQERKVISDYEYDMWYNQMIEEQKNLGIFECWNYAHGI